MALSRTSPSPVPALTFREAMSRLGAAVHLATTDGSAGKLGATVSAVTSVSDTPPSLLVCLNRSSRLNAAVKRNGVFCINTLPAHSESLSNVFAGRGDLSMEERFAMTKWKKGASGSPVLLGARAALDCKVSQISEVGTHSVIFGTVVSVHLGEASQALIYLDRAYHHL